jgi:hypothetical protein
MTDASERAVTCFLLEDNMKLWLLRPIDQSVLPWSPWRGKVLGFVICAPDEQSARSLAATDPGDEESEAWLDPTISSCIELVPSPSKAVIMRDQA